MGAIPRKNSYEKHIILKDHWDYAKYIYIYVYIYIHTCICHVLNRNQSTYSEEIFLLNTGQMARI